MNKKASLLLLVIILLQGCSRYTIDSPSGFASMEKNGDTYFFSPDGVKLKISVYPNDPEQDTEFWTDALDNHLLKRGYKRLETEEADGGGRKSYWVIAYGNEYYIYMTSVYSDKRFIVAAEAAGEKELFEKYKSVIDKSLSTLKIR